MPRNMRSRMGDSHLGRTVLSSSYGKIHFPIKLIVLAGQPCRPGHVISTEWSFLSWVFSHPLVNIFSTRANAKLPLCVSPVLDSMGWEEDFFPFALLRRILLRILASRRRGLPTFFLLWWMSLERPMPWNWLSRPHVRKLHRGLSRFLCLHAWKLSGDSSKQVVCAASSNLWWCVAHLSSGKVAQDPSLVSCE